MTAHWSVDDINWAAFDRAHVHPDVLKIIKAASMVEYNAVDYTNYLKRVFHDDPDAHALFEQWGREETQHGVVLGRWARLADPDFDFDGSFVRFRAGYRPPHFESNDNRSVRGSRIGEMIARCVVESGTSSYYTAMRDATKEPVLKDICARIAADEYRHYLMFFELMRKQKEKMPSFPKRLWVAASRLKETDDDEIAYAYYCATVPESDAATRPYDRKAYTQAYETRVALLYGEHHFKKAIAMVAKAIGMHPQGRLSRGAQSIFWSMLKRRTRGGAPVDPPVMQIAA